VILLQTEVNRMDILATGNYEKTLEELVQQLDKDKRELSELYDHFIREYDLPTEPIMEAVDPESVYGKLILGSRLQLPKRSKVQPMFRLQMAQAQYRRIELLELISIRKQEQQHNDQPHSQKAGKASSRKWAGSNDGITNSFDAARTTEQHEAREHHSVATTAPPAAPETTPQEYFQPKRKTAGNGRAKANTIIAVDAPQLAEEEEPGQKEGGQPPGTDDHDSSGSDATQQSQPADPGSGQQQQQQTQQQYHQQHGRRKHRGGRGRRGRTYVDATVVGTGNEQGDS
jgi:hypothetical protein